MNRRIFLRCVARLQAHRCAVTLNAYIESLKISRKLFVDSSRLHDGPAPLPVAVRRKKHSRSV